MPMYKNKGTLNREVENW